MAALALTGQIAWAVENSWFNTFVFDTITPDPRPVAWMVAASAIAATLTTLLVGTLSDRTRSPWGRRRPYILFGYILWGLSTVLFPTVAYIQVTSVAVVMVVLADSLMTFFGSTANDAAFNAWTADIATSRQRGRVEGVLNLSVFLAQIVALVAAGLLIDSLGYFIKIMRWKPPALAGGGKRIASLGGRICKMVWCFGFLPVRGDVADEF